MKKIYSLIILCLISVTVYCQDGLAYWSTNQGYTFDLNIDGAADFTLPTQTTSMPISQVFVRDFNGDGSFDLCEVNYSESMIKWIFYYNDGTNKFVDPQTIDFGMSGIDKVISGEFNGDGIGDIAIRRDNEWGLWWIMSFAGMAPNVNLAYGITNQDILLAGDMNHDGQDDVVLYSAGNWMASFTPSTTEFKTPDFGTTNINNMKFGTTYDIPVLGDFDNDGFADMGLCSINDGEVSVNLHKASKTENAGYSTSGRGSFDKTITMPTGITPTQVCSVKKNTKTAVNNVAADMNITMFPNPVMHSTQFSVNVGNSSAQIKVLNSLGQVLETIEGQNKITIPVTNWSNGAYFVNVQINGKTVTKKLIVL
ncbi:MAG: T9SS type A sorting domain-containing protein [Bacteroidales bacterium]|nr:T9SS type A sorting domain-containing protein [Bacteroidales bacterium]